MKKPRARSRRPLQQFYPLARAAFGAVLDALQVRGRGGWVLAPAYVGWSSREGSGIYDPLKKRSLAVRFYRVKRDLTVDLKDLKALIRRAPPHSVLLAVHYFGRPDPQFKKMTALARHNNISLIEDAAHAYFSAERLGACGRAGDAVIYSLHKMFDVSGGGLLRINSPDLKIIMTRGGRRGKPAWRRALKKNIANLARARLQRYRVIQKRMPRFAPRLRPFWPGLPSGTIPQTFPVRVAGRVLRDRLYFGLKSLGFPVASLYHTLIAPLRRGRFPASKALSQTIFNLPLSAKLSENDIERMCDGIAAILKDKKSHGR